MANQRAEYLIEKLLKNELSAQELDEFLAGLRDSDLQTYYSSLLSKYFDSLLEQNQPEVVPPKK
ncbi:hypothetical protein [Telluribacter humicola]|uniref:hypothetical protein n=1 Tax=Telluribacter humicola TaxID=1720261 RepID=UPI001A95EFE2|nr:hypothetical protein [Telluribacter humicola]